MTPTKRIETTAHTPGPWASIVPPSCLLTIRHIQTEAGEHVASVGLPGGHGCGIIQDVANARLIAAAPRMFAALKALVGEYDLGESDLDDEEKAKLEEARAAIASAQGNP